MAMQPLPLNSSGHTVESTVRKLPDASLVCGAGFGAIRAAGSRLPRGTLSFARCEIFSPDVCSDINIGLSWGGPRGHLSVSAAVAAAPPTAFDEEEITPWRLEGALHKLHVLKGALADAKDLEQKLQILDENPRVKNNFGKGSSGCSVSVFLALDAASDYEIYLLKCLVAAGQEHLLQTPSTWLSQLENASCNGVGSNMNLRMNGGLTANHVHIGNWEAVYGHATANIIGHGLTQNSLKEDGTARKSQNACWSGNQTLKTILKSLIQTLHEIELFYDSIGGIIGYQATALELIKCSERGHNLRKSRHCSDLPCSEKPTKSMFRAPIGPDLARDKEYAQQAAAWGLQAVPEMGEIYPLGGAGDRLGLVNEVTGECLPVAMLPYCGRTLLEGLIRDLQAREFLHFKVYGKQEITPVAIMTSAAKKNHQHVTQLCERKGWFGRQKSNFFLFEQPLIPAVAAEDGHWLISGPLVPILKPGGHGVIWKLASDKGVFDWFSRKGSKAAIVRQISNPIAATDVTLLALAGVGYRHNKKFGFASCERKVGAAEGVNVLVEKRTNSGWEYAVTCIEYTDFSKLGIPDSPVSPGSMQAQYPANTNVLYVNLPAVKKIASSQNSQSLPGMILNLKKPVVYNDYLGVTHRTYAGRVECTMQNVADLLINKFSTRLMPTQQDCLDTFVVYNERRKVTSSAKRQRKPTDFSLHQTPDGSFLDVTRNAHELLTSCSIIMPEMESVECYLEFGPPFIALLHPAIGPLWSITRQKIYGGGLTKGSELQLEISEMFWRNVQLDGSLRVFAENVVGALVEQQNGEKMLLYGKGCGRCKLDRVSIKNKGIDWKSKENVYWQHKVSRIESVQIILHGNSEFEAEDVTLQGSHTFEVPDGFRMTVTSGVEGIVCDLQPLRCGDSESRSWQWQYTLQDGGYIQLTMETVEN